MMVMMLVMMLVMEGDDVGDEGLSEEKQADQDSSLVFPCFPVSGQLTSETDSRDGWLSVCLYVWLSGYLLLSRQTTVASQSECGKPSSSAALALPLYGRLCEWAAQEMEVLVFVSIR